MNKLISMGKRKKVLYVTLTDEQRTRLENLWFYFGNYGPKTTPGNHSFIQRLLENGYDERSIHTTRTLKSELPTPECESAVDAILSIQTPPPSRKEQNHASHLRLISSHEKPKETLISPEMKATLDDIRRRYRVMHERLDADDNAPDAA